MDASKQEAFGMVRAKEVEALKPDNFPSEFADLVRAESIPPVEAVPDLHVQKIAAQASTHRGDRVDRAMLWGRIFGEIPSLGDAYTAPLGTFEKLDAAPPLSDEELKANIYKIAQATLDGDPEILRMLEVSHRKPHPGKPVDTAFFLRMAAVADECAEEEAGTMSLGSLIRAFATGDQKTMRAEVRRLGICQ